MAERQGFEPWVPFGTTVFETAPFGHSGTSPVTAIKNYQLIINITTTFILNYSFLILNFTRFFCEARKT